MYHSKGIMLYYMMLPLLQELQKWRLTRLQNSSVRNVIPIDGVLTHVRIGLGSAMSWARGRESLQKQVDVDDEDEWRRKERPLAVLYNQTIPLELPDLVRVFLHSQEGVATEGTKTH